ncbi:hypothetical protein M8312_08330 [Sphingomonas sp. KRR8]|uniref:hypothetical protein n=1 Tax=Sphingomonas sp. KRR8 TaxID=2942996 RepID=UPI0020218E5C|nr:hypothetical protein [Sphingomonas sp. KRR8]URD59822.1 hypothetical protein M8312_08330 [Sphingomonas sp. KRR8]
MRLPILFATLGIASPALAQPYPYAPPPPPPGAAQLPPEIASGEFVDRMQPVVRALSHALLDMPVGELEAAVEGRPVTPYDRRKRLGDVAGVDERQLDREISANGQKVRSGTQSMVRALPVIQRALNEAGDQVARAIDNLPSPAYPRM